MFGPLHPPLLHCKYSLAQGGNCYLLGLNLCVSASTDPLQVCAFVSLSASTSGCASGQVRPVPAIHITAYKYTAGACGGLVTFEHAMQCCPVIADKCSTAEM